MRIYFGHKLLKGLYVGVALGGYGHLARHVTHMDGTRTVLRPVTGRAIGVLVIVGFIVLVFLYFTGTTR